MKKYVLWPLLAAIGGVGAFLLRLLQRSTGFEVDTGLPIPGNLPNTMDGDDTAEITCTMDQKEMEALIGELDRLCEKFPDRT